MPDKLINFAHDFLFGNYQTSPKNEFDNVRIKTSMQIYQELGILFIQSLIPIYSIPELTSALHYRLGL